MENDMRGGPEKVGPTGNLKSEQGSREIIRSEIELAEVRRYFKFFDRYCDHPKGQFWIITAHPRKEDWTRGGDILPSLKHVRFDRPVGGAEGMTTYVRRIHGYMLALNKSADLHIKESPEVGQYYRMVFIDDLELYFLEQLAEDYPGPIAAIETSTSNYQAMLVAPRFPVDEARARFRGLLEEEVLAIQRHLSRKYVGDTRSVAANQPRRFAQSPNYKICKDGGKPFYAQIAMLRPETGTHMEAENFLKEALKDTNIAVDSVKLTQQRLGRPPAARPAVTVTGRDETESGEAFRHALRRLRRGVPPAKVETEVSANWGNGRAADWAKRTVWNAMWTAGIVTDRYTSAGRLPPMRKV